MYKDQEDERVAGQWNDRDKLRLFGAEMRGNTMCSKRFKVVPRNVVADHHQPSTANLNIEQDG